MSFVTNFEKSLDKAVDAAFKGKEEGMTLAEFKLAFMGQAPVEKKPRASRKKADTAVAEVATIAPASGVESGTEEVKTEKEKKPRASRKKADATVPVAEVAKAADSVATESGTEEVKTEKEKKPRASKKKTETAPETAAEEVKTEAPAPKKGGAKKADEPKPNLPKMTATMTKSFKAVADELKITDPSAEGFQAYVNALSTEEFGGNEIKALMRKFLENDEITYNDNTYLHIQETNALYLKDPHTKTYSYAGIVGQGEFSGLKIADEEE
jgi:hypothetical protein